MNAPRTPTEILCEINRLCWQLVDTHEAAADRLLDAVEVAHREIGDVFVGDPEHDNMRWLPTVSSAGGPST